MRRVRSLWILLAVLLAASAAWGQEKEKAKEDPLASLDWLKGPATAQIGDQAQLKVPQGFVYTGPEGAKKFLQLLQNIPSGEELGLLAAEDYKWFVIYSFDDVGYVKDDEKDSLNADKMLASIREGTEESNEERKARGWSTMTVIGWLVQPHYDQTTSNLEWSLKARNDQDGGEAANHHTRYLGRRGVMNVELVSDVEGFEPTLQEFRQVMTGFSYGQGKDYRSFVPGDKVAEYGLTALVLGGGAAAAAKVGLFKGLWKILLVGWKFVAAGLLACGAAIKRFFSGRKPAEPAPEPTQNA